MPIYTNKGLLTGSPSFGSEYFDQRIDIVRQLKEPGDYQCVVTKRGGGNIRFKIEVEERSELSVEIDVSEFDYSTTKTSDIEVQADGYVVFYSGSGEDAYRVVISNKDGLVMDSTSLSNGELLVVTPLEPGEYEVLDTATKAVLKLTVEAYLKAAKSGETVIQARERIMQEGSKQVILDDTGFKPNKVKTFGDQPAVITVGSKTRIVVQKKS